MDGFGLVKKQQITQNLFVDYERWQKRLLDASIVIALGVLAGKVTAALMTDSSAIYSDAAESVVHVLAVAFAAWALRFARKPADRTHHFGHDKVSYVSSGFEGALIGAAAIWVIYQAVKQFIYGVEIHHLGLGVAITLGVALVQATLAGCLLRLARFDGSPLLRANALHLLTDVWTSVAALISLALYHFTQWPWWDPVIAIIAAANILYVGLRLVRKSLSGLLDEADVAVEKTISELLDRETSAMGLSYHNLRCRHSGTLHWVEFHLIFDDAMTVKHAHELATQLEAAIADLYQPNIRVISHLEPKSSEHIKQLWEAP